MDLFVIISFVFLGIAAFVIQKKARYEQVDILQLLFFSAIALLLDVDFSDECNSGFWTYGLIGIVALNLVLSRFGFLRKKWARLIPPLVLFAILLGVNWDQSLVYLGKSFSISNKATLVLPLIGIVMYELGHAKISFLQKYFGMEDSAVNVQMSFFLGLAILIGAFNAQGYGVFIVGAGFLVASFYRNEGSKHIIHSFFAVSLVWTFAAQNNVELIDLRFPKVMGGIFVGAFIGAFITHIWTIKKRVNLALFICYSICLLILLGVLAFEVLINPSFGGTEAFLGVLVGFAVSNAIIYYHDDTQNQAVVGMTALTMMILVGLTIPPLLVNEEQQEIEELLENVTPKLELVDGEEEEISYPIIDWSGKHQIEQSTSVVSFKMGPKGSVTKGAIKEFSGNFDFSAEITESSFDIKLPSKNLTTFFAMRDESILGEEYLNVEKFALMRFKGDEWNPTEKENEFELNGTFEMLGVKKAQKVLIHRVEEDGKKILVGSGEIDRRLFGMSDDPRQGNMIDFEFRVALK